MAAREQAGLKDVAIARVEQISPFPFDLVHRHADVRLPTSLPPRTCPHAHAHARQDFPNAEVVWAQEEPKNQGAYTYVKSRIATALAKSRHHAGKAPQYVALGVSARCPCVQCRYAGRAASASTATGNKNNHKDEQYALIKKALGLNSQ